MQAISKNTSYSMVMLADSIGASTTDRLLTHLGIRCELELSELLSSSSSCRNRIHCWNSKQLSSLGFKYQQNLHDVKPCISSLLTTEFVVSPLFYRPCPAPLDGTAHSQP